MFQDDEDVISGKLLCALEFVVGGEGYKLVIGFKTKCKRRNWEAGVEERGLDPTRCGKIVRRAIHSNLDALGEVAAIRFLSIDCCAGKPH